MSGSYSSGKNQGVKRKVLITGGSGTVGQAFMQRYRNEFDFVNVCRNQTHDNTTHPGAQKADFYEADVRQLDELTDLFKAVKPDIVVHAAALKHVNVAEMNPSQTVEINIMGSLNVAKASLAAKVPVVVGVSTDKACQPENIYGYSKKILEQIFLEQYCSTTRLVCVRFANVACSQGSVIPYWIEAARRGERLKLTDSRMNRLMFTHDEATQLIRDAVDYAEKSTESFVLCRSMKSVSMLDLANLISDEFGNSQRPRIVGIRPGERLNETLISQPELAVSSVQADGANIFLHNNQFGSTRLSKPLSSLTAEYMSDDEMRFLYKTYVQEHASEHNAYLDRITANPAQDDLTATH
ncbi:MAG: polysaccharide biosynthesis protein [Granulosicoccus sp.]|nr:polysaccharide biosynthesis protein [Granulosicoccus sp.]